MKNGRGNGVSKIYDHKKGELQKVCMLVDGIKEGLEQEYHE